MSALKTITCTVITVNTRGFPPAPVVQVVVPGSGRPAVALAHRIAAGLADPVSRDAMFLGMPEVGKGTRGLCTTVRVALSSAEARHPAEFRAVGEIVRAVASDEYLVISDVPTA